MFNRQLSGDGVPGDLGYSWIPGEGPEISVRRRAQVPWRSGSGLPEIISFLQRPVTLSLSHLALPFSGGLLCCHLSIPDTSKPYLLHFLGEFELLPIKNE